MHGGRCSLQVARPPVRRDGRCQMLAAAPCSRSARGRMGHVPAAQLAPCRRGRGETAARRGSQPHSSRSRGRFCPRWGPQRAREGRSERRRSAHSLDLTLDAATPHSSCTRGRARWALSRPQEHGKLRDLLHQLLVCSGHGTAVGGKRLEPGELRMWRRASVASRTMTTARAFARASGAPTSRPPTVLFCGKLLQRTHALPSRHLTHGPKRRRGLQAVD